jgi:hypothetical protein
VTVSPATARRRTEGDGVVLVALEDAAAAALARTDPAAVAGPAVQQLSVDGVQAPLVGGEWGEVKLLTIGTVVAGTKPETVRTTDLSYFGRRTDAATFAEVARAEIRRRGVEAAGVVAAVSDGAPWCQGFVDLHRPDAVRILDFAHASQRLTDAAAAVWGEGAAAMTWAAAQREELRDRDPDRVLAALRALPAPVPPAPEAPPAEPPGADAALAPAAAVVRDEVLGYLEPRRDQLDYAIFRAQGLPIGSGAVESGCKTVVEARLKGAGRRWAPGSVNPLVALRGVLCGGRWEERWPAIRRARRAQAAQCAHARRLTRQPAVAPAPVVEAAPTPRRRLPHPAIGRLPPSGRPKTVVNGRPTAQHPYKQTYHLRQPAGAAPDAKL